MSYKSGFCGHDSMREKAIKEFGPETRGLDMHVPDSNSSNARTNMRLYKKGGKVHGLTEMQVDLYIPKRAKQHHQKQVRFNKVEHKFDGGMLETPDVNSRIGMANELLKEASGSQSGLRKGGKVHKSHHGHHRHHKAEGGLSDMAHRDMEAGRMALGLKRGGASRSGKNQDDSKLLLRGEPLKKGFHSHDGLWKGGFFGNESGSPQAQEILRSHGLKHGGKAHKAHHKAEGGFFGNIRNGAGSEQAQEILRSHGLKRGGKAHHKSEGGPMRGEHRTSRSNDYESHMVGEKIVHKANGGQSYGMVPNSLAYSDAIHKRGGKVHKSHRVHKAFGGPWFGSMDGYKIGLNHDGGKVKKSHRVHKLDGGELMGSGSMNPADILHRLSPNAKNPFIKNGFKHGGKAHRKHKAEGGSSVPMRGEHPAKSCKSYNYESDMRGEHKAHKAYGGMSREYAAGGECYAAGGVGKIRHHQMTINGKPILPRNKIKHGR